jgi:hypothetical protein
MTFRAASVGSVLVLASLIARVAPLARAHSSESCSHGASTGDSAYVGRYRQSATSVLVVVHFGSRLTARPTFWGATQPLQRAAGDSFFVSNRPNRTVTFHRDASGCVTSATLTGDLEPDGTFPRLADGERAPIELLLAGQGQAALTALRRSATMGADEFARLGEHILNDLRGEVRAGRAFLEAVVQAYPRSANAWAVLGQLQVATADRAGAVTSFRRAYALDSTNAEAREALTRLHALPAGVAMPKERLHLPFPLADVFRTPTDQERAAVERDWTSRDLTPRNVTIVARERVQQGADKGDEAADTMTALIVAHDVHGFRHYGAIIIPDGATPGCCAVVLQAKSFDPEYAPLDIATEEPATAAILGRSLAKRVIYVLPSYRGEALTINGKAFTSQGDRRNAWDGATDDALALLEVAVRTVPEVDSSRVCALGQSRGGTIALLAGERSRRIKCVVDISGPVDWFKLMPISTPGWTTQESVESALRNPELYRQGGGWYLQWFLDSAIAGTWTLADVRHRMLASSPLYFAERLPRTQAHHGVQDDEVPVANGRALTAELERLGRKPPGYAVFFYRDGGHDTNVLVSYPRLVAFLADELGLGKTATQPSVVRPAGADSGPTPRRAAPRLTSAEWNADLDTLVATVYRLHPKPFFHLSELDFRREVATLRHAIPTLRRDQIVVRFMQLVGSLHDGHSEVRPVDPNGFDRWFPVKFYWFTDGLYVIAADSEHQDLLGEQVLRLGNTTPAIAAQQAADLFGNDNAFGERERIQYLASGTALHALGITPSADSLTLDIRAPDGAQRTVTVRAVRAPFTEAELFNGSYDDWMERGEMFGPPGVPMLSAYRHLAAGHFFEGDTTVPLHLRNRNPYWYTYIPETRTLYMQYNSVKRGYQGESFRAFYTRMFHDVDTHLVDRFVLDDRYNSGGAGDVLMPFVHEFIKRDSTINRPGHLYLLVGRKTFSAGVLLEGYMITHTAVTLVGEPASAPLNMYGDGERVSLPHSGLIVQVSTVYHQTTDYRDRSPWASIDLPAQFSAADYMAGRDPAMDLALSARPFRRIVDLLETQGRDSARIEYERQTQMFGHVPWWKPFSGVDMMELSYDLLQNKRVADAAAGFRWVTAQYPTWYTPWDGLAEACLAVGDTARGVAYYRKGMHMNPQDDAARSALGKLPTTPADTSSAGAC